MRIMITGATGMLGRILCKALSKHAVSALSSKDLDVTSPRAVRLTVGEVGPDWIVHAAARTGVDAAETNPIETYRVNALGARNMAQAAQETGSKLLYYSTDYVFDGRQTHPYREWDPTNPLSEYGRSKWAGECFVRDLCPAHVIIRTSWLFGSGGSHFVQKILDRAEKQETLLVVNDQRGSPTFTSDLAYMTLYLIEADTRGTYHVTNSGSCSWYEYAREIVTLRGMDVEVRPADSKTFAAPAPRPAYSVLDNYILRLEGVPLLRPWQEALAAFLRE